MFNYFKGCIKPEHVKTRFRDLALKFHPDVAGEESTRTMQDIIEEYHNILKSFDGRKFFGQKNKEYNYKYSYSFEQSIVDKVNAVLMLKLANIVIEVIGNWIWISGTSRDQASLFNAEGLKFRWSGKHKKWYWSKFMGKKRKASGWSYDIIKTAFGNSTIENKDANPQLG